MKLSVKETPFPGSKKLYIFMAGLNQKIVPSEYFEFYKSSRFIDENCVFFRDLEDSWYHLGLRGISSNLAETKTYLEKLISKYSPDKTIFVGTSMGGFGAILFGALVGNCHTIAFSPQTFVDKDNRSKYNDKRWTKRIHKFYKRVKKGFFDLETDLIPADCWSAEIHFALDFELDVIHARKMSRLEQVKLHEYEKGGHGLVRKLRQKGILQEILKKSEK